MTKDNKLSLPAAILINLNIMLGAGIFINTVELSKQAGSLGFLAYPLIALLMLPLIISIAKLVNVYPQAGFYGYGTEALGAFFGFFSSWSYFTGKLASAMLMIHVALSLVRQVIPFLQAIPVLGLDFVVLSIFIALNMLNVKTGSRIQVWFMVLKIVPIVFSILTGIYLFSLRNYSVTSMQWDGLPSSLPLVLYAASGFEAACSLSCQIKNAGRNAPLAIFISYGVMIAIAFVYQLFFYGAVGNSLAEQSNYLGIFPLLLGTLMPGSIYITTIIQTILYLAIASSALGSGYGILFSNPWNLYAMASNGHVWFQPTFTRLNQFGLPTLCILAEGFLCLLYLVVTHGDQVSLQQTSALACSIAYTASVISLLVFVFFKRTIKIASWIPVLALFNCLILIGSCIRGFIRSGMYPLMVFSCLLIVGIIMFLHTAHTAKSKQANLKK